MRTTLISVTALLLFSTCDAASRWHQKPEPEKKPEEKKPEETPPPELDTEEQFDAMDDNGDEIISEGELADHTGEMPQADINYKKVEKIYDDVDTSGDNK